MNYNEHFFYKDYSLILCLAPRGVGKTLLLTAIAYEELAAALDEGYDNFRIYHNGFLNKSWWTKRFGKDYLVEFGLEDIIETVDTEQTHMSNGLVLIDEIASIQDNRYGAMSYGNILFSHWIVMMRKIGLTIMGAGQNEEVDKRLKMQCDIVGYVTVARKKKGKEAGVTWVYQTGTYTNPGHRRRFFYDNLKEFWGAYDTTRIIKSQQINKKDVNLMHENKIQDQIFDDIYEHLKTKNDKKLNIMTIKKITGVDWEIKKLGDFVRYFSKPVKTRGNWYKGNFDFQELFDDN